jgi:hypothetical protein
MVLLSTGTCRPLWGEIIFTEGVVSDDDDLANEAPVLHQELNKSGYYCEENYQYGVIKIPCSRVLFHFRWV